MREIYIPLFAIMLCSFQAPRPAPSKEPTGHHAGVMTIRSKSFAPGGMIPREYTCDGQSISPPLTWSRSPTGTRSLALIISDPDAPGGTFTHWVIYNLPAALVGLPADVPPLPRLKDGAEQGMNDFGKVGYRGPCPPNGIHRYYFDLYALNARLELKGRVTRQALLDALKGHVISHGELMGRYRHH